MKKREYIDIIDDLAENNWSLRIKVKKLKKQRKKLRKLVENNVPTVPRGTSLLAANKRSRTL